MELKDWLLLLIPIFFNGLIIYLVQATFQKKIKRDEHKDEVKRKISNEFFSLLLNSKETFRSLGHYLEANQNSPDQFGVYLGNFNLSIRRLLDYYCDYKLYLKDFSLTVDTLNTTFEEYISYMLPYQHQQIADDIRIKLQEYINKLFKLICNASDQYLKNI